MHYRNKTWTIIRTPAEIGELNGVWGIAPNDAWAVGHATPYQKPFIIHWDGVKWTRIPGPPSFHAAFLRAVAGVSSSNVWAVGWRGTGNYSIGATRTLAMKWDGNLWKTFPSD